MIDLAPSLIGKVVLYDDADEALLGGRRWAMARGYAVAHRYEALDPALPMKMPGNRVHRITIMHRLIMAPESGADVDHINGNRLDNRRCNLRLVTRSQNLMNSGLRSDNKTGCKGIHFDSGRGLWMAYITIRGEFIHLGRFPTKENAIIARKAAEKVGHGEYARIER